jgi:lyso-ornithine lipid O-acyltransferase
MIAQTARLTLFIGFLVAIGLVAVYLRIAERVTSRPIHRTVWAQRCFRGATWCLGLNVTPHGQPSTSPTLYVCNHVSWCDIPVLGGVLPATFLSKSEVGQWPLIGFLARQAGTVFIKRGGGKVSGIVDQLSDILAGGQSVMVFPEGTTSTGITVLPFHGRLLRAAQIAGTPIQPVSIVYRRGRALDHLAPFINDDHFLGHLRRLLRQPPPTVDILLHPPVMPHPDDKPSELAVSLRATVLEGVSAIANGQPWVTPAGDPPLFPHPSPRAFR